MRRNTTPYHREYSEDFLSVLKLYQEKGSLRLDVLLDKGIDINSVGPDNEFGEANLLTHACWHADVDAVTALLEAGASPHPVELPTPVPDVFYGEGEVAVFMPPAMCCLETWTAREFYNEDDSDTTAVWGLLLKHGADIGQPYSFYYYKTPVHRLSAWEGARSRNIRVKPNASILWHGYMIQPPGFEWKLSGERLPRLEVR